MLRFSEEARLSSHTLPSAIYNNLDDAAIMDEAIVITVIKLVFIVHEHVLELLYISHY